MQTTDIYVTVFRSLHRGSRGGCGNSGVEFDTRKWPYDMGDDPSFYSASTVGANLTWGVCRQQVRNRIRPRDIVVFFSVRGNREDKAPFAYRLCAVATVEHKVSQAHIWARPELKPYRSYRNLLIRQIKRGLWEHHEPMPGVNHKDWLWRIARKDGLRRKHFARLEASDLLREDGRIHGRSVSIAENYVIFSAQRHETHVLAKPPLVAICDSNGQPEEWLSSKISRAIRVRTLGVASEFGSRRDSLRSINKQHSHPIIRWGMPSDQATKWRWEFVQILI